MTGRRGARRRGFGWGLRVSLWFVVFLGSLVAGALLHLDLRAAKRLVHRAVTSALASLPMDRVRLGEIERLGPHSAELQSIDVDIAGIGRGHAEQVSIDARTWLSAWDLVTRRRVIRISLPKVEMELLDWQLGTAKRPASIESTPARQTQLEVGQLKIAHGHVGGPLAAHHLDVDLAGLSASGGVDPKEAHLLIATAATVRQMIAQPIHVDLEASGFFPLDSSVIRERGGRARVRARAGEASVLAVGALTGERLDVEAEVPRTSAESLRALWPSVPLSAPLSLRVRLEGTFTELEVHAEAEIGAGTVRADGRAGLQGQPSLDARVVAADFDLAALSPALPASRFALDSDLQIRKSLATKDGFPVEGTASMRIEPSVLQGVAVPRVEANIDLAPEGVSIGALIHEPGAPVRVDVRYEPTGHLEIAAGATASALADVKRLSLRGLVARGRVEVHANASYADGELSSTATLDAWGAGIAQVSIGALHLEATANGRFDTLGVHLFGHGTDLRAGSFVISDLLLAAQGTKDLVDVSLAGRGGSVDLLAASAYVELGARSLIKGLSARLEHGGQSVSVTVPEIAFSRRGVDVDHLRLDGLGEPIEADLHGAPDSWVGHVAAPSVDLTRIEKLVGSRSLHLGGTGSVDLALDLRRPHWTAGGHLRLVQGAFGTVPVFDVDASFDLHDLTANLALALQSSGLGGARLAGHGTLGSAPSLAKALRDATGTLALTTDRVPIDRLCSSFGCPGVIGRTAAAALGTTAALRVDVEREKAPAGAVDTNVRVSADARDQLGRLAFLEVDSHIDLRQAWSSLRQVPRDAPVEAQFGLERRSLDRLPPIIALAALAGSVEMHGRAKGTLASPFIEVEAVGQGIHYVGLSPQSTANVDVRWATTYDLGHANSELDATSGGDHVLRASLRVDAPLEALLTGGGSWSGDLNVELQRFPLALVPTLSDQAIRGALSGRVVASGIHDKPELEVDLAVDALQVGRDAVGPVNLSAELSAHDCLASLEAGGTGAAGSRYGHALLRARAGCLWASNTIPRLDPDSTIELSLDATRFPIAALNPLLKGEVERLGGTVDAHLRSSGPAHLAGLIWGFEGELHLTNGSMLPLVMGREFRRLNADITADGSGTLHVARMSGDVGAGNFAGSGLLRFRAERLEHAEAEIHVPRGRAIPFTLQGVSYGTLWGDVFVTGQLENDRFLINLRAPTLRGELPPQRSGVLENLDENPAVVVIQPLSAPEERVAMGGGPGELHAPVTVVLTLELGNNVGISREDMTLDLVTPQAPQNPRLTFGRELTLDGSLEIVGGRVPVAGRVFRIDRGVVRFGGDDPADPALDVDAIYEGTDASGTRISVHVGGSAKDIKLTLTSSPPKSESELLAILAFGEPVPTGNTGDVTGQTGSSSSTGSAMMGAQNAAVGVGTAVLTTGINQVLSQSVIPIRTSVSTGQSTQASASVQVSARLRVEYTRQFGATLYGQPADVNRLGVEWRFKPRWLLRTVVGDKGTTNIDVLWQRWY